MVVVCRMLMHLRCHATPLRASLTAAPSWRLTLVEKESPASSIYFFEGAPRWSGRVWTTSSHRCPTSGLSIPSRCNPPPPHPACREMCLPRTLFRALALATPRLVPREAPTPRSRQRPALFLPAIWQSP